jgi:glycerol-3-phosphate acyltransferase PlsY
MNDWVQFAALMAGAYLLGSIPTSVWIGKAFFNKDVRNFGSGNAGATNTIRVLGYAAGIPVLLFDIFKAWLPVYLSIHYFDWNIKGDLLVYLQILIGLASVFGHIYPLYIGFKGGKGVATLAGMALALFPLAFLSSFITFVLVILITRYVSLGSMAAAIVFPVFLVFVFKHQSTPLIMLGVFASVFLIFTHRKNIKKLMNGTENKFGAKAKE